MSWPPRPMPPPPPPLPRFLYLLACGCACKRLASGGCRAVCCLAPPRFVWHPLPVTTSSLPPPLPPPSPKHHHPPPVDVHAHQPALRPLTVFSTPAPHFYHHPHYSIFCSAATATHTPALGVECFGFFRLCASPRPALVFSILVPCVFWMFASSFFCLSCDGPLPPCGACVIASPVCGAA